MAFDAQKFYDDMKNLLYRLSCGVNGDKKECIRDFYKRLKMSYMSASSMGETSPMFSLSMITDVIDLVDYISPEISPMVAEVYQMPKFELQNGMDQDIPNGKRYWFKLVAPYRMNTCGLTFRLTGNDVKNVHPKVYLARDARAITNCYAAPITEIFSGNEGRGEYQNPIPRKDWGRFFHVQVPCGGGSFYRLEVDSKDCQLELWAYGCESLSRVGSTTGPDIKNIIKIPEFSLGFPCVSKLEIIGHDEPVL
jgi:hypothetical protein